MSQEQFIKEISDLNIQITTKQLNLLETFYELLIEKNKVMNLTRITEKKEVYLKHFYDSLTIAKVLNLKDVKSLCDVGSGAGFPGIVLKIFFPNIHMILLDAREKRVNYLNEVIKQLGLKDIKAIHARAEDYNEEKFEIVTFRAVAKLDKLISYALPLLNKNGYMIALKAHVEEELENLKVNKNYQLKEIIQINLPNDASLRTIIKIQKIS